MTIRAALAGPLQGMTTYKQFVLYRLSPSTSRPGKTDKLPCNISGQTVSAHDPANWMDHETACTLAEAYGEGWGVGFVFTESDPFWFLDIDGGLEGGVWSPLALSLFAQLPGCAAEVSSSHKGGHIFGSGTMPAHKSKNVPLGLELYHTGRFVALTGLGAVGDCRTDMSYALPALVASYFPAETGEAREIGEGPVPEWNGPTDDSELLRRAMRPTAAGAFGTKASFADLWEANEAKLAVSYPDAGGRSYDASSADAALAQHLAFWTGCDAERMRRLMLQSGLVRDKYEREDYLPRTIAGAIGRQEEVCKDKPRAELVATAVAGRPDSVGGVEAPKTRSGEGYLSPALCLEHFKGCVYISNMNRALLPDGSIVKPEAFNVLYGGYTFVLDLVNNKPCEDAWKAWTQSKVNAPVSAFSTCFRPDLPLGAIVTRNGQRYANTYVPLHIERTQGDVSPFLNHLAKLLPVPRDAQIFLSYMAALVQYQGTKFQWAPLLQGIPGNGKSFFSYAIQGAVGARYTHWPLAKKLAKEFNAWMVGKVFYAVEDIYVPDSKREIMEDLKPMITGRNIEIEQKGVDQVTGDICGNFIFNSNKKDGIIKTDTDRRFCMLFTAQQHEGDLERDEMPESYMTALYGWLYEQGGQAIVNEFLYTYAIPAQFNPTGDCQRAPKSSTEHEAIAASKGNIEQEIEEAIAQGIQGFQGGWISSVMFDRHLDQINARSIGRGKRREILEGMGYIKHPHLVGGRVNNLVAPDNSKPLLYIHRSNTMLAQIEKPSAIEKAYETANRVAVNHPFAQAR